MWSRKHEVWKKYNKDVLATDSFDAAFLEVYLRYAVLRKADVHVTEVMDLQRYRRIRKPSLVRSALREKKQEPFIFFSVLN